MGGGGGEWEWPVTTSYFVMIPSQVMVIMMKEAIEDDAHWTTSLDLEVLYLAIGSPSDPVGTDGRPPARIGSISLHTRVD